MHAQWRLLHSVTIPSLLKGKFTNEHNCCYVTCQGWNFLFYVARYSWLIQCMKLTTYLILFIIYAVSVKWISFVVLGLFLVPFFCLSFYNYTSFLLQGTLIYELSNAVALFFEFCTLCAEENIWTEEWGKLHKEKIQDISSWDVRLVKQSRKRFTRHFACIAEVKN